MASTMTPKAASASIVVRTSQFGGGPVLERAPIDDGHAAGERAGGLDGDVAPLAHEQVGVGERQHGARVVHGGAGDAVVAADVGLAEEPQQVGEGGGEDARAGGVRRAMRSGVARSWWVRSRPAMTSGPP